MTTDSRVDVGFLALRFGDSAQIYSAVSAEFMTDR